MAPDPPSHDDQQEPAGGTLDLLSIALLVFFVAVLVIVAALLALPMIVG